MRARVSGTAALLAFCIACCGCPQPDRSTPPAQATAGERHAHVGTADPYGEDVTAIKYLQQNWSSADTERFSFTTQGSQIVPYRWFLVLEQAGSERSFREHANMLKYRYLVQDPSPMNPDGLPVGFVKDVGPEREWMGLTCAACHTGQVDYQGIGYRIDGGQSLADVRTFLVDLSAALVATRDNPEKFDRFAHKLLPASSSAGDRDALRNDLNLIISRRQGYIDRNFPQNSRSGHGRVDAFGAILNEVYHRMVRDTDSAPATANTRAADAPVSYPFLWDTPQHDILQWNGAARNKGLGALGRNVGEVLGVFGDFEFPDHPSISGYRSTVQVRNLIAIEDWVKTLWSPKWPDGFPAIDATKRDKGREIYQRIGCAECHAVINRADPNRKITAVMRAVGTDSRMADNFNERSGDSGKLEGAFVGVLGMPVLSEQIGASVTGDVALKHAVIGTILGAWKQAPKNELSDVEYRRRGFGRAVAAPQAGGIYKARPLNGIWATAPYLHNGSVPSLYQLLLPAKDRLATFSVGTRQFDPVNVGFRTDAPGFPKFESHDADGKPVTGNSNEGHEYGTNLSEEDRWALVEYLKTL